MDLTRFAFVCVAYIAMLQLAEAGCKEDIQANEEYKECFTGYQSYLANSGGSMTDGSQIMAVLCSPEGQGAIACMKEHIDNCKELQTVPILSVFGVLDQMGGCQGASQPGNPACMKAKQTCFKMSNAFGGDESAMEGATTEFNKFQEQIKTICGGVKMQFDCFKQYEKQCPELENEARKMMEIGRKHSMPGQPFPDFDLQKAFVMNECPKLPKDFTTNKCVKDKLMTSEYKECYDNATKRNGTADESETMSCDAYKAAFPCLTEALQSCGKEYQDGFRATSNFYLASTHEDCQLTADATSGSAGFQKISSVTFLILVILAFKLSL